MSEHQRCALVRLLGDEVSRCADRDQLLVFARHWLYEYRLLIIHDRAIRTLIAAALVHPEAETAAQIRAEVQPGVVGFVDMGFVDSSPGPRLAPLLASRRNLPAKQ